jgi:hypothetical protein
MKLFAALLWPGILALALLGCSKHEIDTFEKYCEGVVGVDLQKKYEPFWSAAFSISCKADAVRDDYVRIVNEMYMKDVAGRTKRMLWRNRSTLHLTNPSSFFQLDPKAFIEEWRSGIQRSLRSKPENDPDKCLFGTAAQLFDELEIHTLTSKVGLVLDTDTVTSLPTNRRTHFGWVPD